MKSAVAGCLVGLVLVLILASSDTPHRGNPVPELGRVWAPGQEGYGEARPTSISNGGDPTGVVGDIRWTSWGGARATGTGTSTYVSAGQSVAGASVVLWTPGPRGTINSLRAVSDDDGAFTAINVGRDANVRVEVRGADVVAPATIDTSAGDVGGLVVEISGQRTRCRSGRP